MGQDFGLAILYLTALAAYLSLAWQIWCAGRWLYRNVYLMHPTYGEADRYARKYLIEPHPLWPIVPLTLAKEGRQIGIPSLTAQGLEELRSSVAPNRTSADTDTVQATPPLLDISLPSPTVDGLPLAVEDMSWARRSSFRVVDSPASTEET
jgi:hypothetical protein